MSSAAELPEVTYSQALNGAGARVPTGLVVLPGGARVRGRGRKQAPARPDFTLLLAAGPATGAVRSVIWPDFWIPLDPADAIDALTQALHRARAGERVEIACAGGTGRTGTAIAALAIMDGLPVAQAVPWVRAHYRPTAVEMPWQRWWLRRLTPIDEPT